MHNKQESRAVARKARDIAVVCFGLKFAIDIHYIILVFRSYEIIYTSVSLRGLCTVTH